MRSVVLLGLVVLTGCKATAPIAETTQTAPVAEVQKDASPTVQPSGPIITTQARENAQNGLSGSGPLIEAFGNEPFWSVAVHLDELMYKNPESLGWIPVKARLTEEPNGVRYTGKLDGEDFILVISNGTCSDGMSDTVHKLKSELTIGKKTLHGCARPG